MHWIKFHSSILDDYSFNQLPEITQLHLIKLWLVASKNGGKIEGDEKWIAKLLNTNKVAIDRLVQDGFLLRTGSYESVQEIPRVEESRGDKNRVEKIRVDTDVVLVFDFWKEKLNHDRSVLDDKRKQLIKINLKNYSTEDLQLAILGCSLTPFNMGDNDRGQKYDSLKLIFKDSDQIDRFISNAENPPVSLNKQQKLEQSNMQIAQDWAEKKRLELEAEEQANG